MVESQEITDLIEINSEDKENYYSKLTELFGKEIISSASDLSSHYQNKAEFVRHLINNSFVSSKISDLSKWKPDHVLILLTHKCTLECKHCYLFCNSKSNVFLSEKAIDNIFNSQIGKTIKSVTVSGGEPFLSKYIFRILRNYPVKSVFTNLFWSFVSKTRDEILTKLKDSLQENPFYEKGDFRLYFSVDKYHCNKKYFETITNTIELIVDSLPKINIVISNTKLENDSSFDIFFKCFERNGYCIQKINEKKYIDLVQTNYAFKKQDQIINITTDEFPLSNISRALLTHKNIKARKKESFLENTDYGSRKHCDYVVSPDGCVSLYDVFLVPPVPYSIGDFNHDKWEDIINKVSRDQISECLREKKYAEIFNFYKTNHSKTYNKIFGYASSVNQALHFLLLNSKNRLLLNNFLLNKYNEDILNSNNRQTRKPKIKNKIDLYKTNGQLNSITNTIFVGENFVIPQNDPVIIMDLHGVILETTWLTELNEVYKKVTGNTIDIEKWLEFNLYAGSREKRINKLQKISCKDKDEITGIFDSVKAKYHTRKNPKLKKHVKSFLKKINNTGIPLYLISGSDPELVNRQLENAGISDFFERKNILALNSEFEIKSSIKIKLINSIIHNHKNNTIILFEDWIENLNSLNCNNLIYFGMPQFETELFNSNAKELIAQGSNYILKNWNDWKLIYNLIECN